jgi:hypothetical protein
MLTDIQASLFFTEQTVVLPIFLNKIINVVVLGEPCTVEIEARSTSTEKIRKVANFQRA